MTSSCIQTERTHDLSQDSPIQTSFSVNKSLLFQLKKRLVLFYVFLSFLSYEKSNSIPRYGKVCSYQSPFTACSIQLFADRSSALRIRDTRSRDL